MEVVIASASEACSIAAKIAEASIISNIGMIQTKNPFETAIAYEMLGKRAVVVVDKVCRRDIERLIEKRLPVVVIVLSGNQEVLKEDIPILFSPCSFQEMIDDVIFSLILCEDPKVMLPSVINIDRLNIFEEVTVNENLSKIIPKFKLSQPQSDVQTAVENFKKMIEKNKDLWQKKYGFVFYECCDANKIIVATGIDSSILKSEEKPDVGFVRLNLIKPDLLQKSFFIGKKVAVIEKSKILYKEVRHLTSFCSLFIIESLSKKKLLEISDILEKQEKEEILKL
jgi:hypothetical protein